LSNVNELFLFFKNCDELGVPPRQFVCKIIWMYPQKAKRTFGVNDPKFSLFSKFADHFNDIVKRSVTHCCKDTVSELTEGFLNGFRLHYTGPRFHRESSNLVSVSQHKDELKAKVQKEIDSGRIVVPFKTLPIDTLQISPVDIVLKSEFRNCIFTWIIFLIFKDHISFYWGIPHGPIILGIPAPSFEIENLDLVLLV
jgi:hypothetical protein